jgi:hypothetical protein
MKKYRGPGAAPVRGRPYRTMKIADLGEQVTPGQVAILEACSTTAPLTGPQIAARLQLPLDAKFRGDLVVLVRMGRLVRPYGRHGYLLVRCRR